MKRIALLAVAAAALAWVPSSAQEGVFRSGVRTVPVYATVIDAAGRLVPDLQKEDFEILDDGKPQALTVFVAEVQPVSVVVMMDTSGSMTFNLDLLKNGAEQFVIRLLPSDRARLGTFSDKIVLSPQFTSNRDSLVRYLRESIDYGNPTRLWDAGWVSLDALANETNRRVVLLFTDGADTDSRQYGKGDVLKRAQAEDYMIYGIGLRSRIMGTETRPDGGLKQVATETGGGYFELKETDDLGSTFSRVADELHRQYVLGFRPTVLDGKVHKLAVSVKRPGMRARARTSYVADKPR